MASQMIRRRIFTDEGELIREDLAPKDIPNERAALVAYWEKEDRKKADREAKEAAAAAAAAAEPVVPGPEELVAPLAAKVQELETQLAGMAGLQAATPEAVLQGSMQISRAAGAAALVEAAGLEAEERTRAVAGTAEAKLAELEGQVGQTAEAVGQLLADGAQRLDQTSAEMLARTTAAISKRIAGLEAQAASLRGPAGPRGRVGQGLIAGAGRRPEKRPDGSEWSPGDSWLDTKAEGFQLQYLDAAGQWSKPARLVPAPKLINATQNVLDMAPRTSTSLQIVNPGSGSGGGLEKFLISTLGQGSEADLASNANWASAGYDSRAGELWIEILNPATGLSGVVACVFDVGLNATETRLTEFALTGRLFEGAVPPDVDLDVIRGGIPPIPPSVTGVTNIGTAHTVVRVRVGANVGGSANYIIRGGIVWLQQAQGIAIPNDQNGPRPNWTWG